MIPEGTAGWERDNKLERERLVSEEAGGAEDFIYQ